MDKWQCRERVGPIDITTLQPIKGRKLGGGQGGIWRVEPAQEREHEYRFCIEPMADTHQS